MAVSGYHPVKVPKLLDNSLIIPDKQFGTKVGYHTKEFGLNPSKPEDREKFRNIIIEFALRENSVFFGDCPDSGEKDECFENGIFYCSLCGWLIPLDQADEFEKDWINNPFNPGDKWAEFIRWGEWKRMPDGTIKVEINNY